MPSFTITSLVPVAQVLSGGQTGTIFSAGLLMTTSTPAITAGGAFTIRNFGTVLATDSDAIRITSGSGGNVLNTGRLLAGSGSADDGIQYMGGDALAGLTIQNAGSIEATSTSGHAIRLRTGGATIQNSGLISSENNFAIRVEDLNGGTQGLTLVNTGTITGGHPTLPDFGQAIDLINNDADHIINSGRILGSVNTGGGNDIIENTGLIESYLNTGDGDDLVVNSGYTGVELSADQQAVQLVYLSELGAGNDTLDARLADELSAFDGGEGDDLYLLGAAETWVIERAGEGDDTVQAESDVSLLDSIFLAREVEHLILVGTARIAIGSETDNEIIGNAQDNSLQGREGNDTLFGGAGNDSLLGQDNHDEAHGGTGNDSLFGGAGNDQLFGEANDDELRGGAENDFLIGGDGLDRLFGDEGNDSLFGGAGNDSLTGGIGNDTLVGDQGGDQLTGGDGSDLASYLPATAGVRADLLLVAGNTGDAAGDTYSQIEGLIGSLFSDTLLADDGDNRMFGLSGNDSLLGRSGNDTLAGAENNDTLLGEQGTDDLFGDGGNDLLEGGSGADDLFGGDGFDVASYADALTGLRADLQFASSNTGDAAGDTYLTIENLLGSVQADILAGDAGGNSIDGFGGNDSLFGRDGDDTLFGNGGDDLLVGGIGADRLNGGIGFDIASYGDTTAGLRADLAFSATNTGIAAGDTYTVIEGVQGSLGDDILAGDAQDNRVQGLDGADSLFGRQGNDTIDGNAGNDVLFGAEGNDVLTGGLNADQFVFGTGLGASNVDTITDFSVADDTVILDNAIFLGLVDGSLAAAAFSQGTAATLASHRILYDSATGRLLLDADGTGSGAAVHFATLAPGLGVTAADFLVI